MVQQKWFLIVAMAFILCLTELVMTSEAQAKRLVDNGNGTVTDTVTGLMWTKDANPLGPLSWYDAMARCGSFKTAGIGGWRLPSMDELVALSHALKGGHPFTGGQSWYWSSTTFADDRADAWGVYMGFGKVSVRSKTNHNYVWLVRPHYRGVRILP